MSQTLHNQRKIPFSPTNKMDIFYIHFPSVKASSKHYRLIDYPLRITLPLKLKDKAKNWP